MRWAPATQSCILLSKLHASNFLQHMLDVKLLACVHDGFIESLALMIGDGW